MMIVFCMCTYCSKLVSLSGSVWLAKMTWRVFWPLGASFLHEAGGNWSIEPWFGRKNQSRLQQGQLKQKGPGKIQGGSFADGFPWLCELRLFLHCNVHCCSWVWLVIRCYQSFFPGQVLATCNQMHVMNQRGELVGWPWLTSVFPSTRNLTLAFLPWVCSRIQRRRLATVSFLFLLYPFRSFLRTFYASICFNDIRCALQFTCLILDQQFCCHGMLRGEWRRKSMSRLSRAGSAGAVGPRAVFHDQGWLAD